MGAVIPFIPRTVPDSGSAGDGPAKLPAGWGRVWTTVGYGDMESVVSWHGPISASTSDAMTLEIYGEDVTFPLEQRVIEDGCSRLVKKGWVVGR